MNGEREKATVHAYLVTSYNNFIISIRVSGHDQYTVTIHYYQFQHNVVNQQCTDCVSVHTFQ